MKNNIKTTISYLAKTAFVLAFVLMGAKVHATSMVTLSVSNIGTTSATITGRAQNAINDTTVRGSFEYATNPSFVSSNYTDETVMTLSSTVSYSQTITGLTPNTTYYVRALGIGNNEGVAVPGSTLKFTTDPVSTITKPTVAMTVATATGLNSANVELFYNDNNSGSVDVWFEYGTSSSFGSSTSVVTKTGFGNYQTTINGLNENTTYYVRAVAKNSLGNVYSGSTLTFKTDASSTGGSVIYGCMRISDINYNPNANSHVESYCGGNGGWTGGGWTGGGWNWGNWNWGNNSNNNSNNYNHGSYTNPNDVKKTSGSNSNTGTTKNVVKSNTKDSSNEKDFDANKYLASAFFGFGNGFFPTTLVGWLLLIFLILLLIVLTRHYFNKKPVVVVKK